MSYSDTFTQTYSVVDIGKVIDCVAADLDMNSQSTGLLTRDQVKNYAADVKSLAQQGYLIEANIVLYDASGAPIRAAKFLVYTLAGLLAGLGGVFLTFLTYSGEASSANGGTYTLYSIAAVVLGGVSLFGGSGSAIGAIFGALAFRAIGDLLFVFDIEPLWQPLFQGVVLLASVSIGATRLIGVRNRLDLFG